MIRRGDIYVARIDSDGRGRASVTECPVVVMSRDALNENNLVVIVVPLVEKKQGRRIYPSQTTLKTGEGGLLKDMVVLGEQIRAMNVSRLGAQIGHLVSHRVAEISALLKIVLDL